MLLIALAVVLVLVFVTVLLIKKRNSKSGLEIFPEPPGNPILGHVLVAASTTAILDEATKYFKKYGNTLKLRFGPSFCPIREGIGSSDYKFIEFFLSNSHILAKSENYLYLRPWLGNGLLLSQGTYWKRHRKILTPAFHFEILKDFVEVFESVGDILVNKLEKYDGMESVDLHPVITLCTLDIICETAMGTKINAQTGDNSQYVKNVKEMCRIAIDRCLSPLKLFSWTFWLTKDYYIQKKVLKTLHGFTKKVINSKKGSEKKNGRRMAFLDLLLKYSVEENILSDEEIREEVDTFMFEGHDTTAAGICFTLYCLAKNPQVQEKLIQEQIDLFGNEKNPQITYQDLQNMKYLENVIKESLRLYPPVPAMGRYLKEDVEYEGCLIPKGTNIALSIYNLHRNPKYFPEAEQFKPERFDERSSQVYAFIPFSAGSRNCIGQKFAMLEMKSIISKVVRHFEIKPDPKHQLRLSVETVLKSSSGVKVEIKKRV